MQGYMGKAGRIESGIVRDAWLGELAIGSDRLLNTQGMTLRSLSVLRGSRDSRLEAVLNAGKGYGYSTVTTKFNYQKKEIVA